MPSTQRLLRNFYRDSITLMQFSKGLAEQPGGHPGDLGA